MKMINCSHHNYFALSSNVVQVTPVNKLLNTNFKYTLINTINYNEYQMTCWEFGEKMQLYEVTLSTIL